MEQKPTTPNIKYILGDIIEMKWKGKQITLFNFGLMFGY